MDIGLSVAKYGTNKTGRESYDVHISVTRHTIIAS